MPETGKGNVGNDRIYSIHGVVFVSLLSVIRLRILVKASAKHNLMLISHLKVF